MFLRLRLRRGDVKFTLDPRPRVTMVKSFKSLKRNFQKGKRIRMLVDLTRCEGPSGKQIAIGGELTGNYTIF